MFFLVIETIPIRKLWTMKLKLFGVLASIDNVKVKRLFTEITI